MGKVALLSTGLLLGGLLALFGQTYQTGADPWQLFFVWMLLLTPFALIGRFAPLWVLWAVLVNLALTLYFQPTGRFSTEAYGQLLWVQFAANGFYVVCVGVASRPYALAPSALGVAIVGNCDLNATDSASS
ncbi:MAG: DUF2157 domain-containing protein [Marinobacter sp.]|nr:DUF2157 domain-containing protein [Marinobacter sp.]